MFDQPQKSLLLKTINNQPKLVPSDYAAITGFSTRAINDFLRADQEGQNAVRAGKISVVQGESPPRWAVEVGSEMKVNEARRTMSSRALVVVPPPPQLSGVKEYDRMSARINDLDREIASTSSAKRKNEILAKRGELLETQSLMMSFMRENTRALRETVEAHQQTIDVLREHPNHHTSSSLNGHEAV